MSYERGSTHLTVVRAALFANVPRAGTVLRGRRFSQGQERIVRVRTHLVAQ